MPRASIVRICLQLGGHVIFSLEPKLAPVLAIFDALTRQISASVSVHCDFDVGLFLSLVLGSLAGVPMRCDFCCA
jgi:hypothetical protein